MLLRFLLFIALLFVANEAKATNLKNIWNFERVTECVLHHTAWCYNNYGCWCGVGGSHEPIDGIDACCRDHDHCYDHAVDSGICTNVPWEYVDPYDWTCANSTAICTENQSPCPMALCACDTAVVNCWKKFQTPTTKPKCNRSWKAAFSKWFRP